jgi:hypothetical protein
LFRFCTISTTHLTQVKKGGPLSNDTQTHQKENTTQRYKLMKAVTNTIEMKHTNTPKQTNKKKLRQAAITSAHIHTATLCAPFTPRILPTASKPTSGEQRKAYRRAIGGCPTPASQESTGKHSRRKNRKTAYHNVRRVQKANMRHVRNNVAFQVGREGDNDKNRYSITTSDSTSLYQRRTFNLNKLTETK